MVSESFSVSNLYPIRKTSVQFSRSVCEEAFTIVLMKAFQDNTSSFPLLGMSSQIDHFNGKDKRWDSKLFCHGNNF